MYIGVAKESVGDRQVLVSPWWMNFETLTGGLVFYKNVL